MREALYRAARTAAQTLSTVLPTLQVALDQAFVESLALASISAALSGVVAFLMNLERHRFTAADAEVIDAMLAQMERHEEEA